MDYVCVQPSSNVYIRRLSHVKMGRFVSSKYILYSNGSPTCGWESSPAIRSSCSLLNKVLLRNQLSNLALIRD